MSRTPAWKRDIRKLANDPPDIVDALIVPNHIKNSDDRVAAIMTATEVEDGLKSLLKARMKKLNDREENELFGPMGPLGSHGSRIKLAYALELFGKHTLEDLEIIRLVRNAFAHSRKALRFSDKKITAACEHLTAMERANNLGNLAKRRDQEEPRARFLLSCNIISRRFFYEQYPDFKNDDGFDCPLD